ncbi:MAG: bifunctional adenosylcobinamide kinase/adenosylcobinamide-phosphate guanylyltransferase [Candidatus Omnitrophota bacterium]
MGKLTLILGGARSGKSTFALKLAKAYKQKVAFIATAEPLDNEMRARIALHKKTRPRGWKTFEEPCNPVPLIKKIAKSFDCLLIDCLTLLVSKLSLGGLSQKTIAKRAKEIVAAAKSSKANAIIISNEVGMGIVPENKLARDFRDIAGKVNQIMARGADEVFFVASGIPMKIK